MGGRLVAWGSAAVLVLGAALMLAAPALAAFPGQNGKIAFSATNSNPEYPNDDIYAVSPDGSGLVQIIDENDGTWEDSNFDTVPEWSPDGTRLVFNSIWLEGGDPEPSILRVNADGTGLVGVRAGRYYPSWSPDGARLLYALGDPGAIDEPGDEKGWLYTSDPDGADETFLTFLGARPSKASWAPDGTRIVFPLVTYGCINNCQGDLYTANAADGGGAVQLTNTPSNETGPDWSPDGSRIVFASNADGDYDIYSMNSNGTGIAQLTNAPGSDISPSWSPDGTKIAFQSNRTGPWHVYTMNADGSAPTDVIAGEDPDWQPIPVNAYPRPKGASPQRLSLVPAYEQCTAPNRTHAPPLSFDSCSPPAKSVIHVRINPVRGLPGTPADEADVRLRANIDDVRLASDLSDYTGDLELRLVVQVTDRDNTPHPGGPGPATVQKLTHSHPLPCAATADATVGATCAFDTTVEALVPGAVKELQRAIWALDQVQVHDGDGDPFLRQGIFIP